MATTVFSLIPGGPISPYPLMNEIVEQYGVTRREAHDDIHAYLTQLYDLDGYDTIVIAEEPVHPNDPTGRCVAYWLTITDEAAGLVRQAWAA
ncbi:hypothetical protein [Streptomyces clavuligerus]|uniref:hypothetical protein n=1 Tax=Streptomyces clavuligerus TaxID=1901 RepID=UPI0001800B2D|nr:hypothetical protein [Streptomyces clavuligerus]EDY53067.1 hypothetical protein SSCG_06045 [Streptomyces clavuligerus]WDN56016.1 hypothetical protein LL058_29470 [Streptomyces clavuligerus]